MKNIDKIQFIPKVLDVAIPFAHDPDKSYIAGRLFQDRSLYWRVKYGGKVSAQKHNHSHQAAEELISLVNISHCKMKNEWIQEVQDFVDLI